MKRIFYGWKIVGAACALQFILAALLQQALGAYVAVLTEEKGWSKTSLSGAAAMQSVESALLGPILGWAVDRFGAQGMIRLGIVLFAAGFGVFGCIDTLGGFYVAAAIMAVGSSLCGYFPLTVAVVQWFERHRARALSLMGLGTALGGLFIPAVAWSLQAFGWRATALASCVLALVAGLPLAMMIRSRPEDHGETVDGLPRRLPGEPSADAAEAAAGAGPQREFTTRQALRTAAFWLLSSGHGVALLVVSGINVHAITHMKTGLGYTVGQASLVITLMTVSQIGGVAIGYLIGDRYDKRHVSAGCMLMHGAGLLMLTYATNVAMVVAFALLHGTAWGLRGPFMLALRADYFGRKSIGMIIGISTAVVAVGQVGGPMIAGVLADLTGSYRAGFTALALMVGAGSLLFVFARRPPDPR